MDFKTEFNNKVNTINTYLEKYHTPVHCCSWSRMKTSWIFNRCRLWVYSDDVIHLAPGAKQKVMELDMGLVA